MVNLDDSEKIKSLDAHNLTGSIRALPNQVREAWKESKKVSLPSDYRGIKNLVVTGMGGSALGPDFIRSVFAVSVPFQIVRDYTLPSFVNEDTLVVVSSYSGSTEETISAFEDALSKKAKIVGIASGGQLIEKLKEKSLPFYQFDPKYNPSGQPRMGVGYSLAGIAGFLANLELVKVDDQNVEKSLGYLESISKEFEVDIETKSNSAKQTASALVERIPIIIGAEFLTGNSHIFANQTNENAKVFAAYFLLSEANHHLLEGISFPKDLNKMIKFVFLESDLYSERIKERIKITRDLLNQKEIESVSYKVRGGHSLEAGLEVLVFSSFTTFYLAIANGIDPTPIPNVDFFKEQLSKFA